MLSLPARIKNRLIRDYHSNRFNAVARQIDRARPLQRGTQPFTVLSMVQHRDVHAYLLAARSFAHYADPRRIVVVCDPSLSEEDKAVMRQQIPHIEFRRADEFVHPDIPRGGTWERLYAISEYAQTDYVVQLDADTLTLAPIPEVLDAVRSCNGFVIGEKADQKIVTLAEAEAYARPWQSLSYVNIQALSEVTMVVAGLRMPLYVRGCSGFTGFAPDPRMRDELLDFARKMRDHTQGRWNEWGTEQVTSNYLVANAHGTRLLPWPKYSTPDQSAAAPVFVHFIGYMRFINGKYARAARQVLRTLA
ncbi:hypothetical protein [Pseudorhodoferax sp. Leaf274]|uniref:hypothetical protein n=1 Tax=Pseudorhodoferax sp. Leaf274 TaxID=1736318 RepID=UPI000702F5C3|nr:hypothetical protein [Pseudorhodoferax sp. Leaf274]KQP39784.1 hypothetical protein ASF44_08645 [Pseudorhodoferax sp. Leaf274]